jgi:hypothetical protein
MQTKQKKTIWLLCAMALTPQLVQYVPALKPHRYLFYNLYTLIEFYLMVRLFSIIGALNAKTSKLAWIGFCIVFATLGMKYNPFKDFFSHLVIYDYTSYTIILLIFLYRNVDNDSHTFKGSILWITLGILVYAPIASFSMINWAYTHENPQNLFKTTARIINDMANIFLYTAYTIALVKKEQINL